MGTEALQSSRSAPASRCPAARGRGRRRCRSTSAGRSRTCSAGVDFDVVHVHDPFAPSATAVALRHSRSLNVGTFHEPTERVLSTQVARPLVEIFFGRLDARTVTSRATSELIERFFPGSYELVEPGADTGVEGFWPGDGEPGDDRPVRIAFCLEEERGALRLFLRALRRLPLEMSWEAAVWTPGADRGAAREAAARPGPRPGAEAGDAGGADRRRRRPVRRLRRAAPRARPPAQGARVAGPCPWLRSSRSTGSWSATASAACCSRPATRSPSRARCSA